MAKILLVEDNEMNRDMLSRRLIRNGHEVSIAVDGQQGFDMALSERPDLILMDMRLPVIDGWEATHRIKANDATRGIPVIALTAAADQISLGEALDTPIRSSSVDEIGQLTKTIDRLRASMKAAMSRLGH